MTTHKSTIIEVCGVRIALKGTKEFKQAVGMLLAQSGEDYSGQQYIILSPTPITEEKREEIRQWYRGMIDDLVSKYNNAVVNYEKSSGKKRRKAKRSIDSAVKSLNELGWTFEDKS